MHILYIMMIHVYFFFLGKKITVKNTYVTKLVESCTIMWMLPSKVMPYLLRLAAPLMDSSIVHGNDSVSAELLEQLSSLVLSKLDFFNLSA